MIWEKENAWAILNTWEPLKKTVMTALQISIRTPIAEKIITDHTNIWKDGDVQI